jgi:hypothetical protein
MVYVSKRALAYHLSYSFAIYHSIFLVNIPTQFTNLLLYKNITNDLNVTFHHTSFLFDKKSSRISKVTFGPHLKFIHVEEFAQKDIVHKKLHKH